MPLPTQMSAAQARMGKVFLYGEPKVAGKSTLAFTLDPEHTIGFDVEDGLGAIEAYKHRITSWGRQTGVREPTDADRARGWRAPIPVLDENSFRGTIGMLVNEEHPFTVGVIDTADALSQLCQEYVLMQLGGDKSRGYVHASDFDYGKGWSAINEEWALRIGALCRVLESVILISHADRKTDTDRTGAEYSIYTSALGPKGIRNWTLGFVDHILFATNEVNDDGQLVHCVHTQPGRGWEAGGRTVAGGLRLPDPIWLPDAVTSGVELRKALEAVSAPPAPKEQKAAEPVAKPKAKAKAKAKAAAAQTDKELPQSGQQQEQLTT